MLQKCTIWKIFSEFAKQPTHPFQIRELSRILGIAHTSIMLHLKRLAKQKIIVKKKGGVYNAYLSNINHPNYRLYKQLYNNLCLQESGLINHLENELTPDVIILFGSYLQGTDTEDSDIDLFILGNEKKIKLTLYEKKMFRRIQLHFSKSIEDVSPNLQNNILNGNVLSGFIRWKKQSKQSLTKNEHKA